MRIAFMSDFHLGFGGGKREKEAYRQAERAVNKVLSLKPDVVVFGGDLFDTPVPSPDALIEAVALFSKFKERGSSTSITLVSQNVEKEVEWKGIPVIAIHGTHERRIGDAPTALSILARTSLVVYLRHAHAVIDEYDFYGFSGVPEQLAHKILRALSPKPIKNNSFFIFHQNLRPFVPSKNALSYSDLPPGFKYYVAGHIHKPGLYKNLLIIGSTIVTQMKEGEEKKGVWLFEDGKFEFYPIKTRPFFILKLDVTGLSPSEVETVLRKKIERILENIEEEPLIRVDLKGIAKKGFHPADYSFNFSEYPAIVRIFRDIHRERKLGQVKAEKQISVDDLILQVIKSSLKDMAIDESKVFSAILSGDSRKIKKLVMSLAENSRT